MKAAVGFGILSLVSAVTLDSAFAAPYVPTDGAEVLEQLPAKGNADTEALQIERAALARRPDNLELAVRLARRYIERSRAEADPRYLGYAQSTLAPWWNLSDPPAAVLVLRATIRQSLHDFDGALIDLDKALRVQPNNAQAWLTKATVLQVQGDYAKAKQSCAALSRLVDALVTAMCVTGSASLNGEAQASYRFLRDTLLRYSATPSAEQSWVRTALAEMALRLGDTQSAEAYFKQALELDPSDSYLKGAYADFLLDRKRPREVLALLKGQERIDPLLLRIALAEQQLGIPAGEHADALRARFDASRLRGDTVHRREESRFALQVLNEPDRALRLAEENWAVQREPWDVRVYLEAALGAKRPTAAKPVLDWLTAQKMEDASLAASVAKLKANL